MTEENLEPAKALRTRWVRTSLVGALILAALAGMWMLRLPVVEWAAKSWCSGQNLVCTLQATRADLGGVTIRKLTVNGKNSEASAVTADRVAVDLAWAAPWSMAPAFVGADGLTLRVDLTGQGPVLGDLDPVVQSMSQGKGGGKMPRLRLTNLKVIADTTLGPVQAAGQVAATGLDDFTLGLAAEPQRVGSETHGMQLNAASLHATAAGGAITGALKIDLPLYMAHGVRIDGVKADISLDQPAGGALSASGDVSAVELALPQGGVKNARIEADLQAATLDLTQASTETLLASLKRLDLSGTAGVGVYAGAWWKAAQVEAHVDPRGDGGADGEVKLNAEGVRHAMMSADRLVAEGLIQLPAPGSGQDGPDTAARAMTATGTARLIGAAGSTDVTRTLASIIEEPLKAVLPGFASAAGQTVRQAGERFELVLPWTFRLDNGGWDAAARSGVRLTSRSGFAAVVEGAEPGAEQASVASLEMRRGVRWTAAGTLRTSGGGGPRLRVNLTKARGEGNALALTGDAELVNWPVGKDALAATVTGLSFETDGRTGSAAGDLKIAYTGAFAGGYWTNARADGAVMAQWTPEAFAADAPRGLSLSFDEGVYGPTRLGKAALRYAPSGRFAVRRDDAIVGQGSLTGLSTVVRGEEFTADATVGAMAVNWASGKTLRIGFDAAPSRVALLQKQRAVPISIGDIRGVAEISKGWRVTGSLRDGAVKAEQASINRMSATFDLSGEGDDLSGQVSQLSLRIFDPKADDKRLFEAATFEGSATLARSKADFQGVFALEASGVQIASVAGSHELQGGTGSLAFAPTPMFFGQSFQPSAISPVLRGPANVTGRVDIGGAATWTQKDFKASATVDLQKLGFTLANAGEFAGVSGKIAVDDLLTMKSKPGQAVTIGKVTLGMPIENGVIRFQLIGYEAVRLEGAQWPFVGGSIRVKPVDFKFGDDANRIVAEAVNWDLAKLVELFKLKDVKVVGVVSGEFPVLFTTGSARIDKALLSASRQGGVINYSGSTGDAAGSGDQNAKMVFDALKDFRYSVLNVGLDGDIAGRIIVTLKALGRNPTVLAGAEFDLNISLDSALMNLLNTAKRGDPTVDAIVKQITGGASN